MNDLAQRSDLGIVLLTFTGTKHLPTYCKERPDRCVTMRKPELDLLLARLIVQWAGVHVRVLNLHIDETKPSTAIPAERFPDPLRQRHCPEFNFHPASRGLVSYPALPPADRIAR